MGARPSGSRQAGVGDGVWGRGISWRGGVGDGIGDGVSFGIGREVLIGTDVPVSSGRRPHADNARLKDVTPPNLRKSRREVFFDSSFAIAYSFLGYASNQQLCGIRLFTLFGLLNGIFLADALKLHLRKLSFQIPCLTSSPAASGGYLPSPLPASRSKLHWRVKSEWLPRRKIPTLAPLRLVLTSLDDYYTIRWSKDRSQERSQEVAIGLHGSQFWADCGPGEGLSPRWAAGEASGGGMASSYRCRGDHRLSSGRAAAGIARALRSQASTLATNTRGLTGLTMHSSTPA
jgi:hypothetical protein